MVFYCTKAFKKPHIRAIISSFTVFHAADPSGKLSREFGTYIENEGLSLRGTFIIDPDGVFKSVELHDNSIGRCSAEALRKLQAVKFVRENEGHVCPASWKPGNEAIKV